MRNTLLQTVTILTLFFTPFAFAVEWDSLTKQQQEFLERAKDHWADIPEQKQLKLINRANEYQNMSPEEKAEVDERRAKRMKKWESLSDEDKERMKKRHEKYKNMSPEKKARFEQVKAYLDTLPKEERKAIKEQMRNASPEERRELKRELAKKAGVEIPEKDHAEQKVRKDH